MAERHPQRIDVWEGEEEPDIWIEAGADHVELHVHGEEEIETLFHAMGCARDVEGAEDATEALVALATQYLRDLGVPADGEERHEDGEDADRLFHCPRCGDTKPSTTGVCPACGAEMNLQ